MLHDQKKLIVIGAGPAGLTAAYEALKLGFHPIVLELEERVGGLARTEQYCGNHFDLGGHRFFTKSPAIATLWRDMLGRDFLLRPRLSRIYYRGMYFNYPPHLGEAFRKLGIAESARIALSYLRCQLTAPQDEKTFEDWVVNRFGRRLFEIFFKAYTEKVWGLPCSQIGAEWAAQRIQDLSLRTVLMRKIARSRAPKSLIEQFHYPRLGPGMMWERFKDQIEKRGGTVLLRSEVMAIHHVAQHVVDVSIAQDGRLYSIPAQHVISTMPLNELILRMSPNAPPHVAAAAKALKHRDFITVCLVVKGSNLFADNWIYVHEPNVRVARIQNFKNWSPDMVEDQGTTTLGLEYFCNRGDDLWTKDASALKAQAAHDLVQLGLVEAHNIVDGAVVRVKNAYPVYDSSYSGHLAVIKKYLASFHNLQSIGRNGLHRYNNQDHSMMTGLIAAQNLRSSIRRDVWAINSEAEYHEEVYEEAPV
jgi:protoporphyrinogen oxidase